MLYSSFAFAQDNGEYAANYARAPRFKALIHYEPHAEEAHVQFDKQAIEFFHKLTYDEGFIDATQNLLFAGAFRWVVSRDPQGDPFKK